MAQSTRRWLFSPGRMTLTSTPRRTALTSSPCRRCGGRKYGLMIRTECRAAEIWAQTRSRMVSSGVPGPSMRMRHNELPCFFTGCTVKFAWSPVAKLQSMRKAISSCCAMGPRQRKCTSCTRERRFRLARWFWEMFMPPVKPVSPSQIRTLRCVRRLMENWGGMRRGGRK